MAEPLHACDILARLRDYPHDNYLYLGSILKGVALYFAALVGLEILHAKPEERRMRVFPWLASFTAILVSYMKWGRGIILTNSPANILDSIFPLATV